MGVGLEVWGEGVARGSRGSAAGLGQGVVVFSCRSWGIARGAVMFALSTGCIQGVCRNASTVGMQAFAYDNGAVLARY